MNIVRYEPARLAGGINKELFRLLDDSRWFGGYETDRERNLVNWRPAVDIRETSDAFVLTADIPGIDPKDVEITVSEGVLTLKGERAATPTQESPVLRRERAVGHFERGFNLPDDIDEDGVTASGKHGVLEVALPKMAKAQPRRIVVE